MKFIIHGGGDSSVGIPSSEETVIFEGNTVWDKHLIDLTKSLLTEWDDNGAKVYTEEEYNNIIEEENKFQKESLINSIEREYIEKNKDEFLKFIKQVFNLEVENE